MENNLVTYGVAWCPVNNMERVFIFLGILDLGKYKKNVKIYVFALVQEIFLLRKPLFLITKKIIF